MKTLPTYDIEFRAVAKPFTHYSIRDWNFLLTREGDVKVWDDIAGHYTNVNALSDRTKKRLVKIALSQASLSGVAKDSVNEINP